MRKLIIPLFITAACVLNSCGNSDSSNVVADTLSIGGTVNEDSEDFLEKSEEEKIEFCKEIISNSTFTISENMDIPIPENSIFYIISDNKVLNSIGFKDQITFPIVVRFSDRAVRYKGNRFEDGGLSRTDVGRTYDLGSYDDEGATRDIQIYNYDTETETFKNWGLGYHTNSLGRFAVYNFSAMEELPGLPGYLSSVWDFLEYLGQLSDEIADQKINLNNNRNYFFYTNGTFSNNFNGVYLSKRANDNSSESESESDEAAPPVGSEEAK
jgi:hypothetical protein